MTNTVELPQQAAQQLASIKPLTMSNEGYIALLIDTAYKAEGQAPAKLGYDKYANSYVTSPELARELAKWNFEGVGNEQALCQAEALDCIRFLTSRFNYDNWQPLLSKLSDKQRLLLQPKPKLNQLAAIQYASRFTNGFIADLPANLLDEDAEHIHKTVAAKLARIKKHGAMPTQNDLDAVLADLQQFMSDTLEKLAVLEAHKELRANV